MLVRPLTPVILLSVCTFLTYSSAPAMAPKKPGIASCTSTAIKKRPASLGKGVVGDGANWNSEASNINTKESLIQVGPVAVREMLKAQGRYSRKRSRERRHAKRTGEENKIRTIGAPSTEDGSVDCRT